MSEGRDAVDAFASALGMDANGEDMMRVARDVLRD